MSEEVPIFSWNTKTKEFFVLGHKFDGVNSIEEFIDFILNLDKENKELKQKYEMQKDSNKLLCKAIMCDDCDCCVCHSHKENIKLNNILNELESWLEEEIKILSNQIIEENYRLIKNNETKGSVDYELMQLHAYAKGKLCEELDKLKELKGSDE